MPARLPFARFLSVLRRSRSSQFRPRLEMLEERVQPAVSITAFPGPFSPVSANQITAGPDGNLWFNELANNRIGRITPAGVVTEFTAGLNPLSGPGGITAGPDGNLWFTEETGHAIGRITPAGVITEFTGVNGGEPEYITAGPDGNLWFTEYSGGGFSHVGRITTAGVVTEFAVSSIYQSDITAGPDGNVWFTEFVQDRIARITPSGVVTEFNLPSGSGPSGIVTGPDGNIWFTEYAKDRIARITPSGVVTEFSSGISSGSGPQFITVGPDSNLWFTENTGHRIAEITASGVVSEYPIPSGIASPTSLTTGPDGNLWFMASIGGQIGVVHGIPSATTIRVTSSANSVFSGQNVTLTATVTLQNTTVTLPPTGSVTFYDGTTALGTSPLVNGSASLDVSTLAVGTHSITAVFTATGSFTDSTSAAVSESIKATPILAIGADGGAGPQVVVYDALTGDVISRFYAFSPSFTGGVRVAVADVNSDGVLDVIVGAGPGGGPQVIVVDGTKLTQLQKDGTPQASSLLASFYAFSSTYTGGVYVAAAVSPSGAPELAVGAGAGGGPQVTVFDATQLTQLQPNGQLLPSAILGSFYALVPGFTGGVRVALGDVNGDGVLDVIVGAGPGGGPQVIVADGTKLTQLQNNGQLANASLLASFFAFAPNFTGGVFVSTGRTTGGQVNLILSAGAGSSQVEVLDGGALTHLLLNGQVAPAVVLSNFYALPSFTGGTRVGFAPVFGASGTAAILTGAGPGGSPEVAPFDAQTAQSLTPFFALPQGFTGGIFVAG